MRVFKVFEATRGRLGISPSPPRRRPVAIHTSASSGAGASGATRPAGPPPARLIRPLISKVRLRDRLECGALQRRLHRASVHRHLVFRAGRAPSLPSGADQSVFDLVAAVAALSGGSTLVMATRLGVRRNNVRGAWGVLTFTFKEALRTKWLVVFAVTFFLLAADIPLRILGEFNGVSAVVSQQGFPVLLVDSFPLVPLLALPFGAVSIVDDREAGTMQYLLSNPISKFDFFVGRVSGLLLATTTVIFAGFGGAAVLLYLSSAALLKTVLVLMLTAALLNAVMLALALIISEVTSRRATAVGAAIFVWLLLTTALGLDTLSYAVYWKASAAAALSLVFLDPLEASRIAAVEAAHLNQSQTFGQSDYLALHFLGSNLLSVAVVSVLAWFVGLTVLGFVVFSYQDGN